MTCEGAGPDKAGSIGKSRNLDAEGGDSGGCDGGTSGSGHMLLAEAACWPCRCGTGAGGLGGGNRAPRWF